MYNGVLEVFLKLEIRDFKRFKIVVEIEARMRFTYLEYRGFLLDGRLLNLLLQQFISKLLI
jgi:hypothetical protein